MADKDTVQEKAASTVFVELEVQKVITAVEAVRTDVAQSETRLTDKISEVKSGFAGQIGAVKSDIGSRIDDFGENITGQLGGIGRQLDDFRENIGRQLDTLKCLIIGGGFIIIALLIVIWSRMPSGG